MSTDAKEQFNYRHEVLSPLFDLIKSTESCFVIGAGSMGKTRLLDYLMREDVQAHYLRDQKEKYLFIRMDMNRLSEMTEWGFYELAFTTLLYTAGQDDELTKLAEKFIKELQMPLLDQPNPLKALRCLELAITTICNYQQRKICYIFDEFDETYAALPVKVFAHLRGIRDLNKTRLCYALFVRNLPDTLRPEIDNESFYELISRNQVSLGPYTREDTFEMLGTLEQRMRHPILMPRTREKFYELSGGHPGTIVALFSLMRELGEENSALVNPVELIRRFSIAEEYRKLLESLQPEERQHLIHFAHGRSPNVEEPYRRGLLAKGILKETPDQRLYVFNPLLHQYLQMQA